MRLNEILTDAKKKWDDSPFVYSKKDGVYSPVTYGAFIDNVRKVAHKLEKDGFKGKKIMVIGANCIEYMYCDLAIIAYAGVTVNLNAKTHEDELRRVIALMEVSLVLYGTDKSEVIEKIRTDYPSVVFRCMQDYVAEAGDESTDDDFEIKDENACSKIIFTSGTTSNPKGVMLSLKNMLAGWEPLQKRTPFTKDEVVYLFLPLHHTYANIYNFLYAFLSGLSIYLCSDIQKIGSELLEVRPTIFCAVPLIYRTLLENYKDRINMAFGDRIKYMYCGGALFKSEYRKAYKEAGLPLYEAYALTETASSFAIEYPNNDDFESVGTIFENIDAKIENPDQDGYGLLYAKGDCVCIGYYKNDEMNKKAFTNDGYFCTNDMACIRDGKLYIRGRVDNVIVGENGENKY